ncbi:MAG: hypothetical protein AB203_02200 [Parcubacteria bacterium C7867-008]|nr:MAG: hypothetical protein AB203_02200 [Parcubacteria bacterium C7867-008]
MYSPDDPSAFFALLTKKYIQHENFEYFLKDSEIAYTFCTQSTSITFIPIAAFEDGICVAHIALILDSRLPKGEAFFGFLEVPNDASCFDKLWDALLRESQHHGITTLKGPVNGSIWHQYRCIEETDGSEFFTAEPITETYYYHLLTEKRPSSEIQYFSAYRTRYSMILTLLGAASYTRLSLTGFSIKEATEVSIEEMRTIADISKKTFHSNWGYTELTEQEFLQLYSPQKLNAHLNSLYLLYKGEAIIGFLSTAKENDSTLICKTICIVPEYQGQGLGNALAYKLHQDAENNGITKIVYALIREGNAIKKFPKEHAVIFRKYAAFEFTL